MKIYAEVLIPKLYFLNQLLNIYMYIFELYVTKVQILYKEDKEERKKRENPEKNNHPEREI